MANEQASRDLCLAVARALGWRVTFDEPPAWPEGIEPGTQTEYVEYIPHFDDRIEAAWRVVERLRLLGWRLRLEFYPAWNGWEADLFHEGEYRAVTRRCPAPAEAICRAFLALGER